MEGVGGGDTRLTKRRFGKSDSFDTIGDSKKTRALQVLDPDYFYFLAGRGLASSRRGDGLSVPRGPFVFRRSPGEQEVRVAPAGLIGLSGSLKDT